MENYEKLSLLSDLPIGEGKDITSDGLGFSVYAQVLRNAILSTPGPFTIGIFGEWGTGKTSLLKMLQSDLTKTDDTNLISIWCNAWHYEKDEHPIIPLVGQIIYELEKQKGFLASIGEAGESLTRSLRAIVYGFSTRSKIQLPGIAEIEASFSAKDAIDRAEKTTSDPLIEKSLYHNAFEALSSIKLGKDKKVIIIIDDLDRCFPDVAIKLLESIKLILSQPGFIFIIGVSRSVIEGYLRNRYEKEYGVSGFNGGSYLDKIVQLPFYIPSHIGRMKKFSEMLLEKLDEDTARALEEIIDIVGIACANNPRATVRFINNLIVDHAISKILYTKSDVIEIGFFAITRSLQQNWKNVYDRLIKSDKYCQTIVSWKDDETLQKRINDPDSDISSFAKT